MSRLLLLITTKSYKAGAFMAAASRLGVELVVGTERRQATAGLNPAGHLALAFGEPERAVEMIVEHARSATLDAVVAADDEGAVLAAMAAEALGLAHSPPGAVRAARDKLLTRKALASAGLPVPWYESFRLDDGPDAARRRAGYPCVVKPLRLAASRGVMRADDPGELAAAWRRLAAILGSERGHEVLIEGFIPGFEVALEGIVTRGKLRTLALFDKPDPLDGPFFEETIYVTPSRHSPRVQRRITAAAGGAVAALGLTEGPIHAELRCNEEGAWVLEVAPRSIGGLCSRALAFTDGAGDTLSLEELILRHALGHGIGGVERERSASGVMMIPIPRAGILRRVGGVDEARDVDGICDVRITLAAGQPVAPPPEGSRYLGFLFARAADPAAAEAALRAAHDRLEIDVDPAGAPVEDSAECPAEAQAR